MSARLAVAAVLVVLAAARADAQVLSPGPLSQAHAALEGDDHCSDCHQSGRQVVAARCLACHEDLARTLAAKTGLHGRNYLGKPCEECHVEHIGRRARLVRWPGGAMERFDHLLTGWSLEGDHATTKCLDCHTQKKAGKPTFLGARPACVTCHPDPHEGRFTTACQKCHDTSDWQTFDRKTFNHASTRYPLTGAHMTVACEKCHGEPPRWKGIEFASCKDCHDDPHAGKFEPRPCVGCHTTTTWDAADVRMRDDHPWLSLANGHRRVACKACHDQGNAKPPSKGARCVACHPPVHEARFGDRCETCHASIRWLGLPDATGRKAHAQTDYPLEGRHATVACVSCHPRSLPPARRYRGLAYDRCAACHADRHDGEFAARAGGECAPCHAVDGFAPTTFGADDHASTTFALDGKHVVTPCRDCHGEKRPRLDLRVGKERCDECHADPHGGQFAAEIAGGGCGACHSTSSWHDPRVDHSSWPLTGVHARTTCAACHGEATDAARPGTYRGIPRECEGCHDDLHAGQFRTSAPVVACADCHDTERFLLPAFDHAARARYPLAGKHAAVACADCHPKTELRNEESAVRYRLGYQACADCHASPHREPIGQLACEGCHRVEGWKLATGAGPSGFDHDQTGFPLRGEHDQRPCADCHAGAASPPATCDGCHRDVHAGRVGNACEECHTATAWRDTGALERHRRTRMPLTGRHATIDCVACHPRQDERVWTSPPVACWSCHADAYRSPDTHPDHDGDPTDLTVEPFPRDCSRCHRTSGWVPALFDPTRLARLVGDGGAAARHDAWFVLSRGPHRDVACASCHVDARRAARVRCDGCHDATALRAQHPFKAPVRTSTGCLRCHPRGRAR